MIRSQIIVHFRHKDVAYNSITAAEGFITHYFDSDVFLNYSSAFGSGFVILSSISGCLA